MFSTTAILDADDAMLAKGLAYAKEVQRLIETAWALMRPRADGSAVDPAALETFAQAFETMDRSPLGNGMLDLWMKEMPEYVRSGSWERINCREVTMAYDDALMAIGMIGCEQVRRRRSTSPSTRRATVRRF